MYQRTLAPVVGFHACEKSTGDKLVNSAAPFLPSNSKWDWLGPGVYFWENNFARAELWAKDPSANDLKGIRTPAVVGAFIELGLCLDLTQHECLQEMAAAYESLKQLYLLAGQKLPVNKEHIRNLDCAVIHELHRLRKKSGLPHYQTVRAPFSENGCLYEGTQFSKSGHTQIAVRDQNCIKAVFWPRSPSAWPPRGRPPKPKGLKKPKGKPGRKPRASVLIAA